MPHQDKDDLRTPLAELKALIRPFCDLDLASVPRHGNAQLDQVGVVIMALLTFGWSQKQTISGRLDEAKRATRRIFKSAALAGSHQSLMVVLRACGNDLFQKIRSHLVKQLSESPDWLYLGRPTFAVDGSQFAVPRTEKNLAKFAAASRKSKAAYKKAADRAKAKTTQIAASVCLHLTTGLPMFWNLGGSADSERGMLLDMLKDLPPGSRLIMDAYYTGFQFWNQIIDHGFKFVVRAGKNVELLNLRLEGKVKCAGDTVFYWPQTAIDAGADPIILSLVVVMVGRKRMFLLTNDLELTARQMACLYAKRWGVEVFFRIVKQTYERAKLLSRTPDNVKQELQWTLLGVWLALTEGGKHIPKDRRLSPVRVLRVVCDLVLDVARRSDLKVNLSAELSGCVLADESGRKSEKNSKDYPRKKRKRSAGEPIVRPIKPELLERAMALLF